MDLKKRPTLGDKAVSSGRWVLGIQVWLRSLQLLRTVILARLLAPDDIGLFAIALLTISGLENFTQTGLDKALITKKGDIQKYLNTAWVIQVLRNSLLAAILFFSANIISAFFDAPDAKPILQIVALALLTKGFESIVVITLNKQMRFKKLFRYEFLASLFEFIVAILLAAYLKSALSLAFAMLASNILKVVFSFTIEEWRPSTKFSIKLARELIGYGRWVFGTNIMLYLSNKLDSILVGKLLGTHSLGLYQYSTRIPYSTTLSLSQAITKVALPTYSLANDNRTRLSQLVRKSLELNSYLIIPLTFYGIIFAHELVTFLLGINWIEMVAPLKIIFLASMIRSFSSIFGVIYYSCEKPNLNFVKIAIRTLVVATSIFPLLVEYGLLGAAYSILIGNVSIVIVDIVLLRSLRLPKISDWLFQPVLVPLCIFGLVFFSISILLQYFELSFVRFLVITLVFCVLYIIILESICYLRKDSGLHKMRPSAFLHLVTKKAFKTKN